MLQDERVDRRVWVVAGALVVAIGIILYWTDVLGLRGSDAERADETEEEAAWEEDWMLDSAEPEEAPVRRDREARSGERRGRRADRSSPEWQERRARRLEQWRSAVDIAPLGPEPPRFDADAIREALRPGRAALRPCIDEAGGWRAMREAVRGSRAEGRRARRTVTFDVTSEGTVDPASVAMEPAMPAPFEACFQTFYASGRFAEAGDGARVEVPMGGRGGRRRGRGDAGL